MKIEDIFHCNIEARVSRKKITKLLRSKSLVYGEFEILYLIKDKKEAQPSVIGYKLECEPASISRSIKQLHNYRLVTYNYCLDDKRKIFIKITDKGSKLMDSINELHQCA